jgi:hypothetical protein
VSRPWADGLLGAMDGLSPFEVDTDLIRSAVRDGSQRIHPPETRPSRTRLQRVFEYSPIRVRSALHTQLNNPGECDCRQ